MTDVQTNGGGHNAKFRQQPSSASGRNRKPGGHQQQQQQQNAAAAVPPGLEGVDSELRRKVTQLMEISGCDAELAAIALHDADEDVEKAAEQLLEQLEQQILRSAGASGEVGGGGQGTGAALPGPAADSVVSGWTVKPKKKAKGQQQQTSELRFDEQQQAGSASAFGSGGAASSKGAAGGGDRSSNRRQQQRSDRRTRGGAGVSAGRRDGPSAAADDPSSASAGAASEDRATQRPPKSQRGGARGGGRRSGASRDQQQPSQRDGDVAASAEASNATREVPWEPESDAWNGEPKIFTNSSLADSKAANDSSSNAQPDAATHPADASDSESGQQSQLYPQAPVSSYSNSLAAYNKLATEELKSTLRIGQQQMLPTQSSDKPAALPNQLARSKTPPPCERPRQPVEMVPPVCTQGSALGLFAPASPPPPTSLPMPQVASLAGVSSTSGTGVDSVAEAAAALLLTVNNQASPKQPQQQQQSLIHPVSTASSNISQPVSMEAPPVSMPPPSLPSQSAQPPPSNILAGPAGTSGDSVGSRTVVYQQQQQPPPPPPP
uniref:UBA domain-containing protein n=1 Tax=Macrostomum lignano TaxID=282301 RepID=A0A1I8HUJ8_9PLAT